MKNEEQKGSLVLCLFIDFQHLLIEGSFASIHKHIQLKSRDNRLRIITLELLCRIHRLPEKYLGQPLNNGVKRRKHIKGIECEKYTWI